VGSMVRFVHFIVDIIAFSGVRDNWNFVSVVFSIEGNEYILFLVLMVICIVFFSYFKFQKIG
jgi:hypothetical protein